MMEIDDKKLHNDLIRYFAYYEYRRNFVPKTAAEFNESERNAVEFFRNDSFFHARIQRLAADIFTIVQSCLASTQAEGGEE